MENGGERRSGYTYRDGYTNCADCRRPQPLIDFRIVLYLCFKLEFNIL
jgi:hypothetical protein